MATNLFEQLSQSEVPPAPKTLEKEVHRRVNHNLIVIHLAGFALQALPLAALLFTRAVFGLLGYTITGRFHNPKAGDSQESPR